MATTTLQVALNSSARPHSSDAEIVGEVEKDKKIQFTVLIKQKDGASKLPDLDYWQKTPINERKFSTPQELTEKYGSSEEDAVTIASTLREHGIEVVGKHLGAGTLTAMGTPSQIKSFFGVQLKYYKHQTPMAKIAKRRGVKLAANHPDTETYHGYEGKLSLPSHLDGIVPHVVGLDNRSITAPAGFSGDPQNSVSLLATDLARLYNFPAGIDCSNQVIGIYNESPMSYSPADITTYFAQQIPGYQKPPNIVEISLTVGTNTYTNNPANPGNELSLDIQTAATIAQGSTVNVYFTDGSEQGWMNFINRATFPEGNEKLPTVITCSWIFYDEAVGFNFSTQLQRLGDLGVTFFACTGDWGSNDGVSGTPSEHVGYPASDPWVTAVGGTVIGNIQQTAAGTTTFDEYAWSDETNPSSPFYNTPYGATGGGMSQIFPTPPYQIAAGTTAYPDSTGTIKSGGRFIPDIAAHVGYKNIILNGFPQDTFGTSGSTPLMAGLFASYCAQLQNKGFGLLNPTLYELGKVNQGLVYNDILVGNNDSVLGSTDAPYWAAKQGYDPVTGWGSIKGMSMLNELAIVFGITIPSLRP